MATVSVAFSNPDEGGPGPSPLGTGDDGPNNGCVTNGQPTTYAWNAEDQMTCAVGVHYTYDGDGERVEKSAGTMYWGGGPGDAPAESDLSGNLTSEYVIPLG